MVLVSARRLTSHNRLFERTPLPGLLTPPLARTAARRAASAGPDAVVVVRGRWLSARDVERLRDATGAPVVNLQTDNPLSGRVREPRLLDALPAYDLVTAWSEGLAAGLDEAGARRTVVLPFAYDPELYAPEPRGEPRARCRLRGLRERRTPRTRAGAGGVGARAERRALGTHDARYAAGRVGASRVALGEGRRGSLPLRPRGHQRARPAEPDRAQHAHLGAARHRNAHGRHAHPRPRASVRRRRRAAVRHPGGDAGRRRPSACGPRRAARRGGGRARGGEGRDLPRAGARARGRDRRRRERRCAS